MTKATQKPAPQMDSEVSSAPEVTADNVVQLVQEADKVEPTLSLFEQEAARVKSRVALKVSLMGNVRQRLAEAQDYFKAGEEKRAEGLSEANSAAVGLYQGRTASLLSADEVSSVLIDLFGAKLKSDGKPGKTPDGEGEAIRKRIVRAVAAFEYIAGDERNSFFGGCPKDEVSSVLDAVDGGHCSLWTAYDRLAKIKADAATRTEQAFNPKHIADLVGKLSAEGASEIVRNSPALVAAYGALLQVLTVIGEDDTAE